MLKYEQIAQQIHTLIESSNYQPGDKLPSVTAFKDMYDVSKSTIVKALTLLEQDGRIYQAQGSGIFVRNAKSSDYINVFKTDGFSSHLAEHHITSDVIKLELVMEVPKSVMQALKLGPGEQGYYLERVRYMNGTILCIEYSYFNKRIVKYLNQEIAESSIFNYLQNDLQIRLGFSDIYFNVDQLDEKEAGLLQLKAGAPCLRYHQTFYTSTGQPIDVSDITFHYQHAHFYIPSKK